VKASTRLSDAHLNQFICHGCVHVQVHPQLTSHTVPGFLRTRDSVWNITG